MSDELQKFDSLKADVTLFVAPVLKITVSDFKTSQDAIDTGKTIKKYMAELEKKRKELVGPLNDRVKSINAYAKGIEEPLLKAEMHVKRQLAAFAEEQEKIRQAALRKAEEERLEAERKAEEERRRREDELEQQRQEQLAAASEWGCDESEAARIDEELERQRAEAEAIAERERIERETAAKQAEWDAQQMQLKNVRKTWDFEVQDLSQVPKEFLIIQPNKQAILAAVRAGVKIPGIRAFQKTGIALGANSYVPQMALDSEEDSA